MTTPKASTNSLSNKSSSTDEVSWMMLETNGEVKLVERRMEVGRQPKSVHFQQHFQCKQAVEHEFCIIYKHQTVFRCVITTYISPLSARHAAILANIAVKLV